MPFLNIQYTFKNNRFDDGNNTKSKINERTYLYYIFLIIKGNFFFIYLILHFLLIIKRKFFLTELNKMYIGL